jgi:hypothetical protein
MVGSVKTTSAQRGRSGRSLRIAVLLGTSTAVFALLGGLLAEPSFAARSLRVKPAAEIQANQIDICVQYGETSQECLDALAKLAPGAGPRGYESHEHEDNNHGDKGGSSSGSSSGGESSSGSSSGGSSGGESSSGSSSGGSSGGESSGGISSGSSSGSSSGGSSSGGSSSGGGGVGKGDHGNNGGGNGGGDGSPNGKDDKDR